MVPEILPEFAAHYNLNSLKEFPKNFVRPCYFWFISLRLDATSEGRPWLSCFDQELGYPTRPSVPSITEISSNDFVLEDVSVLTGVKI